MTTGKLRDEITPADIDAAAPLLDAMGQGARLITMAVRGGRAAFAVVAFNDETSDDIDAIRQGPHVMLGDDQGGGLTLPWKGHTLRLSFFPPRDTADQAEGASVHTTGQIAALVAYHRKAAAERYGTPAA